jgi:hypothetical protein
MAGSDVGNGTGVKGILPFVEDDDDDAAAAGIDAVEGGEVE